MGILLICLLLIIGGIVLYNTFLDDLGVISVIVGTVCLIFTLVIWASVVAENKVLVDGYQLDKQYIEMAQSQDIASSEREMIIQKIIFDNRLIMTHRRFVNNFFIGIFHSKEVANLELFSFESVPSGNFNVTVN